MYILKGWDCAAQVLTERERRDYREGQKEERSERTESVRGTEDERTKRVRGTEDRRTESVRGTEDERTKRVRGTEDRRTESVRGTEDERTERTERVRGTEDERTERTERVRGTEDERTERTERVSGTEGQETERTERVRGTEDERTERTERVRGTEDERTERTERVRGTEDERTERTERVRGTEDERTERTERVRGTEDERTERTERVRGTEDRRTERTERVRGTEDERTERTERVRGTEDERTERTERQGQLSSVAINTPELRASSSPRRAHDHVSNTLNKRSRTGGRRLRIQGGWRKQPSTGGGNRTGSRTLRGAGSARESKEFNQQKRPLPLPLASIYSDHITWSRGENTQALKQRKIRPVLVPAVVLYGCKVWINPGAGHEEHWRRLREPCWEGRQVMDLRTPTGPPQSRWTVRDDSSSAAAQCSVGHPLVLHQWTQDAAHRTLPHRTLPHRTLPTGHCPQDPAPQDAAPQDAAPQDAAPQDAAHRTLSTGRCPQDAAPQDAAHRTLPHRTLSPPGRFHPMDDQDRFEEKVQTFGKRCRAVKRDPNCPVVMRGWLFKRDSTGLKLWKRRWFVLSEFCLFYYKDSREECVLGSIPLPSYKVLFCSPRECRNRKYAFKVVHQGMRSYLLSADTQEDMLGWVRVLSQSACMEMDGVMSRRCTSYQDFTQLGGSSESVDGATRSSSQAFRGQTGTGQPEGPPGEVLDQRGRHRVRHR
ncbi:hypothetical protein NFI96_001702 [Prochilodus magdalenae]|nr:hypothetical protein NFI96_001702 [Prochilodus magdalenae]